MKCVNFSLLSILHGFFSKKRDADTLMMLISFCDENGAVNLNEIEFDKTTNVRIKKVIEKISMLKFKNGSIVYFTDGVLRFDDLVLKNIGDGYEI